MMFIRKCIVLLFALSMVLGQFGCDREENQKLAEAIEPLLPAIGYLAGQLNVRGNLTGNVINLFPLMQP